MSYEMTIPSIKVEFKRYESLNSKFNLKIYFIVNEIFVFESDVCFHDGIHENEIETHYNYWTRLYFGMPTLGNEKDFIGKLYIDSSDKDFVRVLFSEKMYIRVPCNICKPIFEEIYRNIINLRNEALQGEDIK
jgi:hypothetical protein